jgi:hypothetical protein
VEEVREISKKEFDGRTQCVYSLLMQNKYSVFFVNIILEDTTGRQMKIVAIDEAAAKADIMETFVGVKEILIGGWLPA